MKVKLLPVANNYGFSGVNFKNAIGKPVRAKKFTMTIVFVKTEDLRKIGVTGEMLDYNDEWSFSNSWRDMPEFEVIR